MNIEALREAVRMQEIDTVVVAMTDMQGRLQGKRFHARFFLDTVVAQGTEACAYLLAVDTDMNTVDGYALTSWENGYGDFMLTPDMATMRVIPWQPGTVLVLADVAALDGTPIRPSPRQMLQAQLERAGSLGWTALAGTELEFVVFEGSYEQAWDQRVPEPHAGQPVQRGLLRARDLADRAAAAGHQELDGGRGPAPSSRRKASATWGSTRSRSATPTP